jgi:spore coat protein U-like protein
MQKNTRQTLLLAIASLAMSFSAAQAAEMATTNLNVSATVLDSCVVTAPIGLVFASVSSAASTNQSVQGTISVVCTATKAAVTVNLEGGDNASGGQRYMKSSANALLPYVITSDVAHTAPVAINGSIYSGGLTAVTPNLIPVYGQVPAGNYAAGAYTDTLRVTLNY